MNQHKTSSKSKGIILAAMAMLIVVAALFLGYYFTNMKESNLKVYGEIPSFELLNATGEQYNSENNKIKLLTFLLLNCPDGVCPLTMVDFSDLEKELKKEGWFGKEVELVAITFDPERDQLEDLLEYSKSFNADLSGWKFLRGEQEEIKALSDSLNYFYYIGEDGAAVHPTTMYILDGDHQIRAYHKMSTSTEGMNKEAILKDIKKLVKERN